MSTKFTIKDVADKSTDTTGYIAIDKKVYEITNYMAEHPGGDDILAEVLGQDASEAFHEVGHSQEAKERLESLLAGELIDDPQVQTKTKSTGPIASSRFKRGMVECALAFLVLSVSAILVRFRIGPFF